MKFVIDRNDLAEAVSVAAQGLPNIPRQPVRAGILIRNTGTELEFTGSDGDTTFTAISPFTESSPGQVIVPGKLFAEITRSLPPFPVSFSVDSHQAVLACGKGKFVFPVYSEEYPVIAEPAKPFGTVAGKELAEAVSKVAVAASHDDAKPAITCVRFEHPQPGSMVAVATDRYRFAAADIPFTVTGDVVPCMMPAWAAERFCRGLSGDVGFGADDRVVTFRSATAAVTSRCIDGSYPDWRKLLPAERPSVEVAKEELTAALRRCQVAAEQDDPVTLTFTHGNLRVQAGHGNRCDDSVDAAYTGERFEAFFGIRNLMDGVAGCDDICRFGFTAPLEPVHLQSGTFTYVVLPRRQC